MLGIDKNNNSKMWWGVFVVTTIITLLMLAYVDEWFWLALPFSLTSLCKAMNVI